MYRYLTTGVLRKDIAYKFLFRLLKNPGDSDWSWTGILLLGKGIPEAQYDDMAGKYENKIIDEQFFGVGYS